MVNGTYGCMSDCAFPSCIIDGCNLPPREPYPFGMDPIWKCARPAAPARGHSKTLPARLHVCPVSYPEDLRDTRSCSRV